MMPSYMDSLFGNPFGSPWYPNSAHYGYQPRYNRNPYHQDMYSDDWSPYGCSYGMPLEIPVALEDPMIESEESEEPAPFREPTRTGKKKSPKSPVCKPAAKDFRGLQHSKNVHDTSKSRQHSPRQVPLNHQVPINHVPPSELTRQASSDSRRCCPEDIMPQEIPIIHENANDNKHPPSVFDQLSKIAEEVDVLEPQVCAFSGQRKDKSYIILDESLTKILLRLDMIKSNGDEEIRNSRKKLVKCVQSCIDELERKVATGVAPDVNCENGKMEVDEKAATVRNCQNDTQSAAESNLTSSMETTTDDRSEVHVDCASESTDQEQSSVVNTDVAASNSESTVSDKNPLQSETDNVAIESWDTVEFTEQ